MIVLLRLAALTPERGARRGSGWSRWRRRDGTRDVGGRPGVTVRVAPPGRDPGVDPALAPPRRGAGRRRGRELGFPGWAAFEAADLLAQLSGGAPLDDPDRPRVPHPADLPAASRSARKGPPAASIVRPGADRPLPTGGDAAGRGRGASGSGGRREACRDLPPRRSAPGPHAGRDGWPSGATAPGAA